MLKPNCLLYQLLVGCIVVAIKGSVVSFIICSACHVSKDCNMLHKHHSDLNGGRLNIF